MSRVGKIPVQVTDDVKVEITNLVVKIQGPKGVLEKKIFWKNFN
jgi:ribosomal protein L6P/L9E